MSTLDARLLDAQDAMEDAQDQQRGLHRVDPEEERTGRAVVLGPVFSTYLAGQSMHLLRVALWWSGLSPLVLALTGKDSALGVTRGLFNLAVLLFSPLGGAVAERHSMRRLLTLTTIARMVLYSLVLPISWVFLRSEWIDGIDSESGMFVVLSLLCFLDGIQVAFANVIDVDMGGVDILGKQLGLPVSDGIRNKMNATFQIVFDSAFLVFTPACALLAWWVGVTTVDDKGKTEKDVDAERSGVLVATFAIVFFLTSVMSLAFYSRLVNRHGLSRVEASDYEPLSETAPPATADASADVPPASLYSSIVEGAKLCWKTKPVRYRLLFLGLEVAAEDAMVAVVIAEYAFTSRYFGNGSSIAMYLYTAVIIAVGKLGALAAGAYMHSCWQVPVKRSQFFPLFVSILLSSLSTLLLWLAFRLETSVPDQPQSGTAWLSRGLVFLGVVLFFTFSTAPKIGLQTLLQGLASSVDGSGKIFGFVGPFVSVVDALVVLLVSIGFGALKKNCHTDDHACISSGFSAALGYTCAIYIVHGVLECFLGPRLIIPREPETLRSLGLQDQ